jgi:glycosyltransferase involved in cell wall biosynthesis
MLIFEILFYSFIVVILIQILFYGIIFGNFSFKKSKKQSDRATEHPISVIICAKNEAKNLKKHLPFILEQEYSKFEIILINDSSSDKTLKVMESFKTDHKNIKIVDVKSNETFYGNKKYALTLGIKVSTYNHLLFTDADCKPLSNQWIKEMSSKFSTSKSIVIGYGAYKKQPKSFLNKLIRFETLMTAIQYISYAKMGQPYMAVGRNLAYTKSIFFESRGFMNHMYIKSGDDDLFVNEIATASNTALCLSKESFTESLPKNTYADWLLQKRRHISTAKHYKTKHKALLALFYISQLSFFVLAIVMVSTLLYWKFAIGLIILRYIVLYATLILATKKLNEKDLTPYIPLLELFLVITQISIFIKNLTSKPNHWK